MPYAGFAKLPLLKRLSIVREIALFKVWSAVRMIVRMMHDGCRELTLARGQKYVK
jgi:hypothetical protein